MKKILLFILLIIPFSAYAECALSINGAGEYEVGSSDDLMKVGVDDCGLDAKYRLTDDIQVNVEGLEDGFEPINHFSGEFHGAGHRIINLKMGNRNMQGFFGMAMDGLVDSLGFENVLLNGGRYTGAVVGWGGSGTISNVYVTGNVLFSGFVPAESFIGGIAGVFSGTIENCYFDGKIGDTYNIGGVVGQNEGVVKNSYAINTKPLEISYMIGKMNIGAVVGVNERGGSVVNSYGMTFMENKVVGLNNGSVDTNSAFVKGVDYNYNNGMKQKAMYVGFDFEKVWGITEGKTSPFLKSNLKQVRLKPILYKYEYCTGRNLGEGFIVVPDGVDRENYAGEFVSKFIDDKSKIVVDLSKLVALNQNGYTFVTDTLNPIVPMTLVVSGLVAEDKVYDGTNKAVVKGEAKIEGVCKNDVLSLKGELTAFFRDANVGENKNVVLSGLSLEGDSAVVANYKLVLPELTASIKEPSNSLIAIKSRRVDEKMTKIHFDGHAVSVEKNFLQFDIKGKRN